MNDHKAIDCPVCSGKIYIQPNLLVQGVSFSCSNPDCDASIALSNSSYSVTNNALNELEKLKQTSLNLNS
jgi:hypothetical protein